ncbi:hypothetical protein V6N13_075569 [Hibiscus sabdariffa]|uniref:Uncharacterized protein n=1 Tax=Hibiscus sabdariffa TaxID=183260 RepID=A0ABR2UBY0_9ROSI
MNMAGMDFVYQLDVDEVIEESVLKLDLTPLHRSCSYHIHTCLGLQEQFRDYYFKNRSLQLTSDLQIPFSQALVESHQTCLAQIAGYFIVQDRVLRTSGVLDAQFAQMVSATHLLLVKDYITLLGTHRKHKLDIRRGQHSATGCFIQRWEWGSQAYIEFHHCSISEQQCEEV